MPNKKSVAAFQADSVPADPLAAELDYVPVDEAMNEQPAKPANPKTVKGQVFRPPLTAMKGGKPAAAPRTNTVKSQTAEELAKRRAEVKDELDNDIAAKKAEKAAAPKAEKPAKAPKAAAKGKKADEPAEEFDKGQAANRKQPKIVVERDEKPKKAEKPAAPEFHPHGLVVQDVTSALVEASQIFRITEVGLRITGEPTRDQWVAQGERQNAAGRGLTWANVDWMIGGEERFGQDFYQYADIIGLQPQSITNLVSSLSKYTFEERVPGVSITAHQEVAYLDKTIRQELLLRMQRGEIKNIGELREARQQIRGKQPAKPAKANGDALVQDAPVVDGNAAAQQNAAQNGAAPRVEEPMNPLQQLDMDGDGVADAAVINGGEQWLQLGTWQYLHEQNGVLFYADPDTLDPLLAKYIREGKLEGKLRVTIEVLA